MSRDASSIFRSKPRRAVAEVKNEIPIMTFLQRLISDALPVLPKRLLVPLKHSREMAYWRTKHSESAGVLRNAHYRYFYTSYFDIAPEEYSGRAILDIGCGPRGSLEWADNAKERVGLDPLVDQYQKLGIGAHRMRYSCAPSEKIPFPDEYFDFVSSFNSLDHVDKVDQTLSEITRVLKKDGSFLVITEINHPPTPTEPHTLSEDLIERLSRDFSLIAVKLTAIRSDHDIYGSLRDNIPYAPDPKATPGILSAHMRKRHAARSLIHTPQENVMP
jgi:ubiquinone/menaquinone biosynthesis C-methylase UbiE